jgi:hypothetical protein
VPIVAGTTAGTYAAGDDPRLSDERTPQDNSVTNLKLANMAQSTIKGRATASTGDPEDLSASDVRTLLNTDQVTDARTPASHTHGNLSNAGAIGTTANLPLRTGTNGVIEAGSFGTAAGSFCEGNDARLSDARTPTAHKVSHSIGGTDALAPSDIGAQFNFVIEVVDLESGDVVLSAARAKIILYNNFAEVTRSLTLPTSGNLVGDAFIIRRNSSISNVDIIQSVSQTITTTPSFTKQYAFIWDGSGWQIDNVNVHTHVVADVTGAAASGSITTSGLTQATARILGRTTASTGSIEEIQIGSGLSLSAGELSATGGSGGGEVRSDFVSPYTYTGLADAGTSESTASWLIRRSEFDAGGSFVATLTASAVQWANRLTASYA